MTTSPTLHKPLRPGLFAALYFTEGAPIGLLWWALPSVLRSAGVEVSSIASLVAIIGIPWALKFLWAPLIDLWRSERWGYRDWIVASQVAMGVSLIPVAIGWSELGLGWLSVFLLLHALSAATQDVAIDGLCIVSMPETERGRLNGWMQAGMLSGRSLFGGATLIVLEVLSFEGAVLALVAVLWSSAIGLRLFVPNEDPGAYAGRSSTGAISDVWEAWKQVVAKRASRWALAFAALSGASFEAVGTLAGPYLVDAGVSTTTIGWFLGTVSVAMMALGALLGGRLADRWPRRRAVLLTFVSLGATVTALALASLAEWEVGMTILLALVYANIGLFTSSTYAWFMDLSQTRFAATQFSAYMGTTNACEVWSTAAGGRLVGWVGYGPAFLLLVLVSMLSLEFLRRARPARG